MSLLLHTATLTQIYNTTNTAQNTGLKSNMSDANFHLVVTVVPLPLEVIKHSNGSYSGAMIEVLNILAVTANFQYTLVEPARLEWGDMLSNGTWTGMVGDLVEGRADLALSNLAVSYSRYQSIDFTTPCYMVSSVLVGKKTSPRESKFLILNPLRKEIWFGITISLCGLSVYCIWTMSIKGKKITTTLCTNILQGFLRIQLKQSLDGGQSYRSYKSGIAAWMVFTMFITCIYQSNLYVNLSQGSKRNSIQSREDLVNTRGTKVYIGKGTNTVNYLRHATSNTDKDIWNKVISGEGGIIAYSDLHKMAATDGSYFITDEWGANQAVLRDPTLYICKERFNKYYVSLAMRKSFTAKYKSLINRKLQSLFESGILSNIYKSTWITNTSSVNYIQSLPVTSVAGSFIVAGVGLSLGCLAFMVECALRMVRTGCCNTNSGIRSDKHVDNSWK